jgi:hypothetical protein
MLEVDHLEGESATVLGSRRDEEWGVHRSSASSAGPVETGLRKTVSSLRQCLRAVLQRRVEKMVLPTSVLAP